MCAPYLLSARCAVSSFNKALWKVLEFVATSKPCTLEVGRPRRSYSSSLLSTKGWTEDSMRSGTALTI